MLAPHRYYALSTIHGNVALRADGIPIRKIMHAIVEIMPWHRNSLLQGENMFPEQLVYAYLRK